MVSSNSSYPPDDGSGPSDDNPDIHKALKAFDAAWRKRPEPALRQFVVPLPPPARLRLLVELIKRDQDWRHRSLCAEPLEDYVNRWPEIAQSPASQVDLLESECLCRGTYEELPELAELTGRFPTIANLIDLKAVKSKARSQRTIKSFLGSGRFFKIRAIGRGGMGVVYSALDRQYQSIVALKQLAKPNAKSVSSFKQEFRLLSEIVHHNLVRLYDLFSDSYRWFITMELIEGDDMLRYVRGCTDSDDSSQHASNGDKDTGSWSPWSRLDFDRLRNTLRQLAQGVQAIHEAGRLHRDIKPSNVMVKPDGTVVLLDFGLITELTPGDACTVPHKEAVLAGHASEPYAYSSDGWIVGTASYMSPEQAGGQRLTAASDWYAVGVMLYEMLTGSLPFVKNGRAVLEQKQQEDAPPLPKAGRGIPSDIASLCSDLLARDPAARPTADEVLRRLDAPPGGSQESIPFVGRKDYLHSLHEMFRRVLSGKAVTVCLSGRSGVGKTRLVEHFLQQLTSQHEAVVLAGRCYERESVPFKALDSLLDSLIHYLKWLPEARRNALLPPDIAALARVFPALGTIDSISDGLTDLTIRDPLELRRRAFHALRELLTQLGNQVPLVLHIDDLQWGDADSAAVLSDLVRGPDIPRLLILVSYRSEYEVESACLKALAQLRGSPDHRELEVDPLSPDDSRELAQVLWRGSSDAELIERIAHDSQGSPYFISELVRNATRDRDGPLIAATSDDAGLDGMLWRGVQQLTNEPRQLLESICVAGCPVRIITAYRTAGVEPRNERALAILKAERFVRTSGPDLEHEAEVFHDRIRETVLQRLDRDTLRSLHMQFAAAFERDGQSDPEAIAFHFREGGDPTKAAGFYRLAAEQASNALAFNRAAELYRLALDLNPTTAGPADETHERLAGALANAGRSAEAAVEYRAAAEHAAESKRAHLRREAAYQYLISGHFDTGRQLLASVLESIGMRLPPTPRRALLSLLGQRLQLRLRGLRFHERSPNEIPTFELTQLDTCWSASIGLAIIDVIRGSDYQTRCLLHALRAGEPLRITRALALESIFTAAQGTHTTARTLTLLNAAERIGSRVNEPYAKAVVQLAKSGVAMLNGQYRTACECSQLAEEIFRTQCVGTAWELDTALTYRMWSLIWRGEAGEVRRAGRALLDEAQQRGDLFAATNLRAYALPHLLLWEDNPDEAKRTLDEAMLRWSQNGFFAQHLIAMVSAAEIELYKGNGQAAWSLLSERWPAYKSSLLDRIQFGFVQLTFSRARSALLAAHENGQRARMLRSAEQDAKRLDREPREDARAMAATIRAGLAMHRQDTGEATEQLKRAIDGFSKMEMTLHMAASQRGLGKVLGGEEGQNLIAQAEAVIHSKTVREPHRLAAALVPGFDRT